MHETVVNEVITLISRLDKEEGHVKVLTVNLTLFVFGGFVDLGLV